jgi:hypothetical protein
MSNSWYSLKPSASEYVGVRVHDPEGHVLAEAFPQALQLLHALARHGTAVAREEERHRPAFGAVQLVVVAPQVEQVEARHLRRFRDGAEARSSARQGRRSGRRR